MGAGLSTIALAVAVGVLSNVGGDGANVPAPAFAALRLQYIATRDVGTFPARGSWCMLGRAADHCYNLQESTGDATDYGTGSWHLTPTGTRRAVVTSLLVRSATGWADVDSELASWGDGGAASGLFEAGAVPSATNVLSVSMIAMPVEDGVLGSFASHRDTSPPNAGWFVYMPSGGNVSGSIDYGAGIVNVSGASDLRHSWHCITVVLDARTSNAGRVYVDDIDDTQGAGDLSAASGGFTATAPFRIHGVQNSPSFASRHGVARLRLDEGHATSFAEHQQYCGDAWQAPAGGVGDNKPLASDSSWTQTAGAGCWPTGASTAVCSPGGMMPYTRDATGIGWPVQQAITSPVLYSTAIDCTNWTCGGTATATPQQVAPDGSPTASTLTVAAGANDIDQTITAGYTPDATPLYFGMWIKCASGVVDIRGNCGGTCGQISVDCSCVGGAWRYIWSAGAGDADSCVTITNPFNADGAGTSGVHFEGSGSPISANVWAPTLTEQRPWTRVVIPTGASGVTLGDPVWAITNGLGNTGDQLMVDGSMEAVAGGDATTIAWAVGNNATLTKETGTPHGGIRVLRVGYNGTSNPYAAQSILVNNTIYRVIGWARGDGTAFPILRTNAGVILWTGTTSTSWQLADAVFDSGIASGLRLRATTTGASYADFDDVTIYEQQPWGPYYRAGDTVTQSLTEYSGSCWAVSGSDLLLSGTTTCSGTWYGLEIRK